MGNKIANIATAVITTAFAVMVYDMAAQTETGKGIIKGVKGKLNKIKQKCKSVKENWD